MRLECKGHIAYSDIIENKKEKGKMKKLLTTVGIALLVLIPLLVFPMSVGATGTLSNVYTWTSMPPYILAWSADIVGDYWYVGGDDTVMGDGKAYMMVYNITNATNPVYVSNWSYNSGVSDAFCALYAYGDFVYVGEWYNSKVFAINVTDKTNPTYVSNYTTSVKGPYNIQGNGTHMWVLSYGESGDSYLECIDISVPGTMTELGQVAFASGGDGNPAGGLVLSEDSQAAFATVSPMHTFHAFNITTANPVETDNLTTASSGSLGQAHSLAINGTTLYVSAEYVGNLTCIDVSDIADLSIISTFHYQNATGGVDTQSSYKLQTRQEGDGSISLFAVCDQNIAQPYGYIVHMDVTDPSNIDVIGYDNPFGDPSAYSLEPLVLDGDYLYTMYAAIVVELITMPGAVSISVSPSSHNWGTVSANHGYGTPDFNVTNDGSVAVDITIEGTDFVGSPTSWTLSGSGTPGYATYGLDTVLPGDIVGVVNKTAQLFISDLAPSDSQAFGFLLFTPTGGMGTNALSNNITLVATQH